MKKTEKQLTPQEARRDTTNSEKTVVKDNERRPKTSCLSEELDAGEGTSSSTRKTIEERHKKAKTNRLENETERHFDTFQNHNLAPDEWDALADQLLHRGV